jgi:putative transposase
MGLSTRALDRDRHWSGIGDGAAGAGPHGQGIRFESKLVPPYVRRAKSIDALLPWLYLRGISQADTGPALEALVGKDVANLSGPVVGKLKRRWADEYAAWGKADLSKERWVYLWADGCIRASVRRTRSCVR